MIFVDSWAWIALADRSDQYHAAAEAERRRLRSLRRPFVTSNVVLTESIGYLFRVLPFDQARAFFEMIWAAVELGPDQIIHLSPDQFRRAWQLRVRYHDKPGISFVDLTSMVVMQDLGITEVFTGDAHFEQVGLGFRRVP